MTKILLVDDDTSFSEKLSELLSLQQDFSVETANSGLDALQLLTNFAFDLILLDWGLPDLSGLELCKRFRGNGGQTPIIFLTGRDKIDDKEAGFDAGGDDYLTKPFEVRELLARVKAVRRRRFVSPEAVFRKGDITFDSQLRSVKQGTRQAQLSPLEGHLLEHLFRHPNKIFSSAQLFNSIWTSDDESSEDTVRVHIRVLRQKLSTIGCGDLIKTIRGSGYLIELEKSD